MGFLKFVLGFILVILIPVYPIVLHMIYQIIKGYIKGETIDPLPSTGKLGFFHRLYIKFPIQFVMDLFNRDPNDFQEYGLRMICGEQGSGKTTALVYLLGIWKNRYPEMKIMTNMGYLEEDASLNHWKDITSIKNGRHGVAVCIDEIQTWFSSLQSKDFPVEMLSEISQQRKQRKVIVGTAQVFSRIAKPIREQTHKVYLPMTLFGCLTIVRETHAKYWDNEEQKFKRYTGMFFFVHDAELRSKFNTFQRIEKYSEEGFKSDAERASFLLD